MMKKVILGLFFIFVSWTGFSDTTIIRHPNGNWLFSSAFQEFSVWNIETGEKIRSFGDTVDTPGYKIMMFAISPNGKRLLARYNSGIVMWDIEKYEPLWTITDGYAPLGALSFSPDSTKVIYQSYNDWDYESAITGNIVVLNSETGNIINTLARDVESLSDPVFSPDGINVAGGLGNDIKIWNVLTGREIWTLTGHTGRVNSVCYNNDGRQIISGANDQTIKIWSSDTGGEVRTISMEYNPYSVAISPNGRMVASSSGRNPIVVLNLETGASILALSREWYAGVLFTVNNTQIISHTRGGGSRDTVTIWDVNNGDRVRQFLIPNDNEM